MKNQLPSQTHWGTACGNFFRMGKSTLQSLQMPPKKQAAKANEPARVLIYETCDQTFGW
jgi:hypothetical protein